MKPDKIKTTESYSLELKREDIIKLLQDSGVKIPDSATIRICGIPYQENWDMDYDESLMIDWKIEYEH